MTAAGYRGEFDGKITGVIITAGFCIDVVWCEVTAGTKRERKAGTYQVVFDRMCEM